MQENILFYYFLSKIVYHCIYVCSCFKILYQNLYTSSKKYTWFAHNFVHNCKRIYYSVTALQNFCIKISEIINWRLKIPSHRWTFSRALLTNMNLRVQTFIYIYNYLKFDIKIYKSLAKNILNSNITWFIIVIVQKILYGKLETKYHLSLLNQTPIWVQIIEPISYHDIKFYEISHSNFDFVMIAYYLTTFGNAGQASVSSATKKTFWIHKVRLPTLLLVGMQSAEKQ